MSNNGKHKAKYMKHFFVKSFWISLILLIIVSILAALTFDMQAGIAEKLYAMDSDDYAKILCTVMGIWKVLIIQFTLIPAIVSVLMYKYIEKNGDEYGCGAQGCDC